MARLWEEIGKSPSIAEVTTDDEAFIERARDNTTFVGEMEHRKWGPHSGKSLTYESF